MKRAGLAALIIILPLMAWADSIQIVGRHGSWAVFIATDPMTDNNWYGAIVTSDAGGNVQVDCTWQHPQKLNVAFHTKEFLGSGFRDATYRVDSKAARTITASYSDNGMFPLCDGACKRNGKSQPEATWAADVKGGANLLLRLKTYRGQDVNLSFRIDGAQEAFEQVLGECAKLAAEKKKRKQ